MPEYAAAMELYAKTIAKTLDTTYTAPEFDDVAVALRAVPRTNRTESDKAARLAGTIEQARAVVRSRAAAPAWIEHGAGSPSSPSPPAQPLTREQRQADTQYYLNQVAAP